MSSTKPETKIQEAIQKACRARGAYVLKLHGGLHQTAGVDLYICYRGMFIAIEVKVPDCGSAATARQAKILNDVSKAGGRASVAYSVEDAMHVLDSIDEEMESWQRFKTDGQRPSTGGGPNI